MSGQADIAMIMEIVLKLFAYGMIVGIVMFVCMWGFSTWMTVQNKKYMLQKTSAEPNITARTTSILSGGFGSVMNNNEHRNDPTKNAPAVAAGCMPENKEPAKRIKAATIIVASITVAFIVGVLSFSLFRLINHFAIEAAPPSTTTAMVMAISVLIGFCMGGVFVQAVYSIYRAFHETTTTKNTL